MVAFGSLISTLALGAAAVQPVAAQWYVIGVKDDWSYRSVPGSIGYTTHSYSITARDMNSGKEEDTKVSGVGRSESDMCGSKLMGAEVWCFGDVTKQCQGYIAAFKSRSCRTYCPSIGDKSPVYNYNFVTSGEWLRVGLVCDKPYP